MKKRIEFLQYLADAGLSGAGAEIGVAHARFSRMILETTKIDLLFLVDPWRHYPRAVFQDVVNNRPQNELDKRYMQVLKALVTYGLCPRVHVIRAESLQAVALFPDGYFNFVYIDANHMYDSVKADMEAWYPKVRAGGVFAGHDYIANAKSGDVMHGVKRAVDEFSRERTLRITCTDEYLATWWLIKPRASDTLSDASG